MIYLILSPAFKDKHNPDLGYEKLLKIGYTGEESKKSRFDTYITENPTCKILYLIEGGTQGDEKNLHYHFKHLKVNYGNEWFKYDSEIIEFFDNHETRESLKELKRVYSEKERSQISLILSDHKKQSHINYLINKIRKCGYEFQYRELLMEMSLSYDRIGEYIKENYHEIDDDFCLREEIDDTLRDFYKQPNVSDKYEYLCSLSVSTSLSCLSYLPESFVNYYTVLGPDKMKALRYNATDMRKAYENLLEDQLVDVKTPILSEFLVGERYTKIDIKNKLKRIYDSVGYSKTPKAVDLGDYFIISTCRIQNIETGKRDAGYLIVSIKEGD